MENRAQQIHRLFLDFLVLIEDTLKDIDLPTPKSFDIIRNSNYNLVLLKIVEEIPKFNCKNETECIMRLAMEYIESNTETNEDLKEKIYKMEKWIEYILYKNNKNLSKKITLYIDFLNKLITET